MKTLEEYIAESIQMYICEGFDIDRARKVVSFNANHQDNVDTNDYVNPYIILNDSKTGEKILSIFERKDNSDNDDGNPIVYALKNIKGWRLNNPKADIYALLKRVISVTKHLNKHFDTVLITPSHNELNNRIFNVAKKFLDYDNIFSDVFDKIPLDEIFEGDDITDIINSYCSEYGISDIEKFHAKVGKWFRDMKEMNDGVFSYKYIPVRYRNLIKQSVRFAVKWLDEDFDKLSDMMNNKDVLILDDTVATGKTLSDCAEAIRATFAPRSVTFLTLFSPKASEDYSNNRVIL